MMSLMTNGYEATIKMKINVPWPAVILTAFLDLPEAYTDPVWDSRCLCQEGPAL